MNRRNNNIMSDDDALDQYYGEVAPASSEEVKTYSIQKLSDFKDPILQIVREMGIEKFGDDQVRGMYIFGSQAYFSKVKDANSQSFRDTDEHGNELIGVCYKNDEKKEVIQYLVESDFDIILVVDEYKSEDAVLGALASDMQSKWETSILINTCLGEEIQFKLDVSVYNTRYFISYMHFHQPVYNQAVTSDAIDQFYVIYEDEKMRYFRKNWCIHYLNIPRLIQATADELDYCYQKAKRFFEIAQSGTYSDERENYQDAYTGYLSRRPTQVLFKTSKKNIVHAKRKLFFSKQMLANNEIIDYREMNIFQDYVFTFPNYSWSEYENKFVPEFEELKSQFTSDCNEIVSFGNKLLERQKNAINFLNKYCLEESRTKVRESFFSESNHLTKKKKKQEIGNYVANLFMNGIYILNHLFGIRVIPFEAYDNSTIENASLFQISIPPNMDKLHPYLMALDGSIIKFDKQYSIVSTNCGKIVDLRDSTILPNFDDYLHCFKVPCGKRVSMFHYNNEWKVSCPELDNQDWIDWPLKQKLSNWREEFWRVWKQQNLSLDELSKEATVLLVWNENQLTIIGKYGANESICRSLDKPNSIQEDKELTLYIQDGFSLKNLKQKMIQESVKLNPKEYSGYIFMQDDGQVVYHLSSPLYYLIPRLTLANKFYSGVDVLNKDVIEKCTDPTLLQNSENDRIIISCAAFADDYEGSLVEDCFRSLNPVFRFYYLTIRKELLKEENKEHIPLLREAALTLEYSSQVNEIIEDIFYNAESMDLDNDDSMSETN